MKTITPAGSSLSLQDVLAAPEGATVSFHGMAHAVRDLGDVCFVLLRTAQGALQCVVCPPLTPPRPGDALRVQGTVCRDARAPGGVELRLSALQVLTSPEAPMPAPIDKFRMRLSQDTDLALRPVTLRNLQKRAVFKVQEGVVRGFRECLQDEGFTEIHTPKLGANTAEGGANVFRLDYFGRRAALAQSPQFYKQTMVGVFERVFEVGPVFRAEKHNTARHLNEYTSLDLEMGFIDSFEDVMRMEVKVLSRIMEVLRRDYAPQLQALDVRLPACDAIPAVRFDEAKRMAAERYGRPIRDPFDLEPEEEQLISRLFEEEYGSQFVFVTHYPSKKRPFYAKDDPADPRYTLSFDLLLRGMEITTGGERISGYSEQVEKMRRKGLDPADFGSYLMIHRHGMPPHGGLGIGLERLTARLVGAQNVREACLFPRDTLRLDP